MKKRIILLLLLILIVLSGCNGKYKSELQSATEQDIGAEEKYTPNTYLQYELAIDNANELLEKTLVSKKEILNAHEQIESAIENLCLKADKTELISLVKKTDTLDEDVYTTKSYKDLIASVNSANAVINNENAPQEDVEQAIKRLNNSLNCLVEATVGVYRINYSFELISNNHVGNDWVKTVEYNGKRISSGETITAPLNSTITIVAKVTENDNYPDCGSATVNIPLNGEQRTTEICVRENRGRYCGNIAIWKINFLIEAIEMR